MKFCKISNIFKGYSICLSFFGCLIASLHGLETNLESRIINGTEVKWNNTRYVVSVRLEATDRLFFGAGHICGGSLIASDLVLTASHCIWNDYTQQFRNASEFSIVMGNLDRTSKYGNSLKIAVKQIITGSNFNPSTYLDDIAILVLKEAVAANFTGASVIELNKESSLRAGTNCTVLGWGKTEKGTYPTKLMSVDVPIIDQALCRRSYGRNAISDGMLCAGYMAGERDACYGDSGGPLVCDNKLVGIVSFGVECALPGYPGVYTNVAYYLQWIRNQLLKTDSANNYYSYIVSKNSTIISNSTNTSNSSVIVYNTNSTTGNSTQIPSSSSIVYVKSLCFLVLPFLSVVIKLM